MLRTVGKGQPQSAAFDWYQASISDKEDNIIEAIINEYGCSIAPTKKGQGQYDHAVAFFIPVYEEAICVLSFGGNQGAVPHLKATGHFADTIAPLIKKHWPSHNVTRVDSCYDFCAPGLYDELEPILDRYHHANGIYRCRRGFPENGRTFYLGSKKSPVQLRCYEKDKEQEKKGLPFTPGHLRFELQVRPLTRDKGKYAALSADEVWGAAKWSRSVVNEVLAKSPAPIKREPTMSKTPEQALADIISQYARRFQEVGEERAIQLLRTFYAKGTKGLSEALLEPVTAH